CGSPSWVGSRFVPILRRGRSPTYLATRPRESPAIAVDRPLDRLYISIRLYNSEVMDHDDCPARRHVRGPGRPDASGDPGPAGRGRGHGDGAGRSIPPEPARDLQAPQGPGEGGPRLAGARRPAA